MCEGEEVRKTALSNFELICSKKMSNSRKVTYKLTKIHMLDLVTILTIPFITLFCMGALIYSSLLLENKQIIEQVLQIISRL